MVSVKIKCRVHILRCPNNLLTSLNQLSKAAKTLALRSYSLELHTVLEALALHVRWCLWPPGIAMHYAAIRSFAIVVTPHAAPHSRTATAARVSQLYAILTLTSAESQVRSPLCCHDCRAATTAVCRRLRYCFHPPH